MKMSNKVYDVLKWIALIALDALGLLYSTLSAIWNLPFGDEILRTCSALSMCLGTLIGISSVQYKKSLDSGKITFLAVDLPDDEDDSK